MIKRGKEISNSNSRIVIRSISPCQNSRGQFYIIAAVIIIAALLGFFALKNYVKIEKEQTRIYDLGKELKIETGSVYDYGIYKGKDTSKLIENWSKTYSEYILQQGIAEDWIFVYGNEKDMSAVTFTTTETGGIEIYTGRGRVGVKIKKGDINITSLGSNITGQVNVTFHNFNYTFDLEEGENFFFVIKSEGTATTG